MVVALPYKRLLFVARILLVASIAAFLYSVIEWELVPLLVGCLALLASGIIYFSARHYHKKYKYQP
jgi:hypothetical protein